MSSTNETTLAPRSASTPNARLRARGQSLLAGLVLAAGLMPLASVRATSASADEFPPVIVLPGATSAEGIAVGRGSIFYAGDFLTGDIYRGDLRTGHAELFIDAAAGRMAVGLKADVRHGLLFVAGGFTGQAYVYDLETGKDLATFQLLYAQANTIPVILLKPFGDARPPNKYLTEHASEVIDWDERALVDAVRKHARHEDTTRWDTIEFKLD